MNLYGKVCSFLLICQVVFLSIVQGQVNDCDFVISNTEFIYNSDYEITIIVSINTNNIQADGIAYLVKNNNLQSLGIDIFWNSAAFSVHSDDETFQISISGTSTSVIAIPDELILSGRIAFSFSEVPVLSNDNGVKNLEEDSVLVDTAGLEFDAEDVVIVDTSVVVLDSAIIQIDSLSVASDTLTFEADTLSMVDNSGVEFEDSLLLIITPVTGDSVLIGHELLVLENLPNLCEAEYVCELPVNNESDVVVNEVRISNDSNIDKSKNNLTGTSFGSIFEGETFKMEELSINVFPNPAVEYFYIHSNISSENSEIIIYTINGNIVLEKDLYKASYQKINTIDLPEGLYFVLLKNDTEASQLTKLIIK